MLVETIIRKTLGLNRHRVEKVVEEQDRLVAYLTHNDHHKLVCSCCDRKCPGYDTLKERRWKHVPLWGIPVILVYAPRRVACRDCGIKVEAIPWTQGKSPLSVPLSMVLATWAGIVAWKVVAQLYGFHWNTVCRAVKNVVDYGLEHQDLDDVAYLGIDEISRKKGHVYHTQVYDLAGKRLLWSGEERTQETLGAFADYLGDGRCESIEAICCDMWAPYIGAIRERFPNALLVFDKFHIVRHLMDAVDEVRKQEAKRLRQDNPELLKGSRYIWLKNPWNLTDSQKSRLSYLEKLNLRTNRAYLLKEAFRKFWDYSYTGWARKYLDRWFWWATHSRLEPIREFAWMIRRHQEDILNFFKVRINNGAVEGLNSKAKAISRRAYGYRSAKTFILALMHGMGDLPTPPLTHKFV